MASSLFSDRDIFVGYGISHGRSVTVHVKFVPVGGHVLAKPYSHQDSFNHRRRRQGAGEGSCLPLPQIREKKIFFGQTSCNIRAVDIFLEEGRTGTLYFFDSILFLISSVREIYTVIHNYRTPLL